LLKAGRRVSLQHKPFRILELLLRQPGTLVTRQKLVEELWPGLHVNFEHGLNTAVNSLRQVLGDSPRESRFIETRPGLGYRFIAPIEQSSRAQPRMKSSDCHQDYLKGRFFLQKMTGSALQRAIGHFQSAFEAAPDNALALSGLADTYSQLALSGTVRPAEVTQAARESSAAALRSGPDLAEAQVALGRQRMIFDCDWTGAAEAFNTAIRLDRTSTDAYRARALLRASLNNHEEALRDIRQAQALSPLSLPIGYELAWLLCLSKNFQGAVDQAWAVLSLDHKFFPAQEILGIAYGQLAAHEDAVTECENACICSERHPSALASLGYAYGAAGHTSRAEQILAEILELAQRQYVSSYFVALVQLGLRQHDCVLESLQRASLARDPLLLWLSADPRFLPISAWLHVEGIRGFPPHPRSGYRSAHS
jgi:DNA-binding winged helix-turn-helix (wHTH) protein/Tfp pilus assembly protein PilF